MKAIHDLFKEEISTQSIALPTVKHKIKSDPILLQESHRRVYDRIQFVGTAFVSNCRVNVESSEKSASLRQYASSAVFSCFPVHFGRKLAWETMDTCTIKRVDNFLNASIARPIFSQLSSM